MPRRKQPHRLGRCRLCRLDYFTGEPLMPYAWVHVHGSSRPPRFRTLFKLCVSVHLDCFNSLPAKRQREIIRTI